MADFQRITDEDVLKKMVSCYRKLRGSEFNDYCSSTIFLKQQKFKSTSGCDAAILGDVDSAN